MDTHGLREALVHYAVIVLVHARVGQGGKVQVGVRTAPNDT